jgi:Leucine rich repeat
MICFNAFYFILLIILLLILGTDFPRITGTHLTERFDEDVYTVYANYQNTRNIPPVICRQFIGTVNMMIMSSYVETINEESFASCLMLENLHFDNNEILSIPDNTFRNNPTLIGLFLNGNRINHIGFTAFTGSGINFLDIANNAMFELNPVVLEPINSTLTTLDYLNNRLGIMYNDAFANVRNIRTLILSGNAFYQLPGNSFQSLTNLEELGLSNCAITTINPAWFDGLSNLHTLFIGSNRIVDLPDNVFNTLTSLRELHIFNNGIIQLRNAAFGASITSLTLIYGIGNDLNVVDPAIINSATNLNQLFLQNNLCTSYNFYNVNNNTASVINRLESCVTNFEMPSAISCNYSRTIGPGSIYWCQMSLHNPVGETFMTIEGDHIGTSTNNDVSFVAVDNQNTKVIPSIICDQFPRLSR